jgi:hypothetical protein
MDIVSDRPVAMGLGVVIRRGQVHMDPCAGTTGVVVSGTVTDVNMRKRTHGQTGDKKQYR